MIHKDHFAEQINLWVNQKIPFVFFIDYAMNAPLLYRFEDDADFLFNFNGFTNHPSNLSAPHSPQKITLNPKKISFTDYKNAFLQVQKALKRGESYLTNLTFPTPISPSASLSDIYLSSQALYKAYVPEKFVFFSPESFIRLEADTIATYPMKGTIDAALPNAIQKLQQDEKEKAEHFTIVDLLRNDLSQVAREVRVEQFQTISRIQSIDRDLYQMSSTIRGKILPEYQNRWGDILHRLLPAGSICGAPKPRTLEIIDSAELAPRGYYCGIAGCFTGTSLDSCVMIRMIQKSQGKLYYHSGGGITAQSELQKEYQELNDKIYVPIR